MPAKKKSFTSADSDAVSKMFFLQTDIKTESDMPEGYTGSPLRGTDSHGRGKRTERLGLLLDEQLKEELSLLFKATNSKSINDLIVSILIEYVEREESQVKLKQYRELIKA